MTKAAVEKLMAGITDNGPMIRVFKVTSSGVACVHRSFRTDSVRKFIAKKIGQFEVTQQTEKK